MVELVASMLILREKGEVPYLAHEKFIVVSFVLRNVQSHARVVV